MTQAEIISIADEYAPNGLREVDEIECEIIISDPYNLYRGFDNNEALENLIAPLYSAYPELPDIDVIKDGLWDYNQNCISELALTRAINNSHPEDIEAMTEKEFREQIEDEEGCIIDYLSYNGHLDDTYEICKFLSGELISCTCSVHDDVIYEIDFDRDEWNEVILNHSQVLMFPNLYDKTKDDNGVIPVFNMGGTLVHVANY